MPYRITVTEINLPDFSPPKRVDMPSPIPPREREIYRRERDELDLHAVIIAVDGLDRVPEKTQA